MGKLILCPSPIRIQLKSTATCSTNTMEKQPTMPCLSLKRERYFFRGSFPTPAFEAWNYSLRVNYSINYNTLTKTTKGSKGSEEKTFILKMSDRLNLCKLNWKLIRSVFSQIFHFNLLLYANLPTVVLSELVKEE